VPSMQRDGTKLFFVDEGAGSPPFVFVHGWTCDHTFFAPQVGHFREHHRVVAVDLRGHGRSDAPEQDYTIGGFADDVAALCVELGLEPAVLVGHSMGGTVVLETAARHPGVARAVVMVDAAPIASAPILSQTAQDVGGALVGPDAAAARQAIVDGLATGVRDDPDLVARITAAMFSTPEHVAMSCIANLGAWDGEVAAGACRVPALHIGADDPINDAAALRALNPRLRTGQTVGAGHFNQLEVPEQVNAMIERFLAVEVLAPVPSDARA